MLLEGLFIPLTTPFYPDGRLNLRKLEHNAARYSKTPAAGLAVLSEFGDPTLLTDDETRDCLKYAIEATAIDKVMLAGVSRDSVFATVELARFAASLGYDAVLVGRPRVLRGSDSPKTMRELLTYLQAVADQSALPIVLESSAAGDLPIEILVELAGHPNVLGVVEEGGPSRIVQIKSLTTGTKREVTVTHVFAAATGRMLAERDTAAGATFISADSLTDGGTALAVAPPKPGLRTRTKTVGFQVVGGSTKTMLASLQAGAVGVMTAFAACAPQASYEVLAAWKDGDTPLAEEKQVRILAAAARVESELGGGGVRYGCDLNGYFGGRPRLPMLPVTGEQRAEIEALMQTIRN